MELLEAYILKLCSFLYSDGQGSLRTESEGDDVLAPEEGAKDSAALQANREIKRAKIRRLLLQLDGRATSSMALQLLEKASWDVERAAELARSEPQWARAEAIQTAQGAPGEQAVSAQAAESKSGGNNLPPDATSKANELVLKLYNTVRVEDAMWLLRKQGWDLDKAYEYSLHLQKTQTLADMLSVVKEFVFIGENRLPPQLPKKLPELEAGGAVATVEGGGSGNKFQAADAAEMERLPGRRVRDEKAFVLLCTLWDRVTDDAFRIQILDLALEIYGEHPLNFFSLQEAPLLPKVMRALDVLSPQLRERTLKVLEYVVTVADCGLPLGDLCLMNSCLDSIWGKIA